MAWPQKMWRDVHAAILHFWIIVGKQKSKHVRAITNYLALQTKRHFDTYCFSCTSCTVLGSRWDGQGQSTELYCNCVAIPLDGVQLNGISVLTPCIFYSGVSVQWCCTIGGVWRPGHTCCTVHLAPAGNAAPHTARHTGGRRPLHRVSGNGPGRNL